MENKVLFGDGSHILYVNGKYRGNDEIGKLMHDFSCTNPDDMNYEALAKKAQYFKQDEKGVAVTALEHIEINDMIYMLYFFAIKEDYERQYYKVKAKRRWM